MPPNKIVLRLCWLWLKILIDRINFRLKIKTNVLIFLIWFAQEGWCSWSFPGFVHFFFEKGSNRKAETYYILLWDSRFHSTDSTLSITTTNQSVFLEGLYSTYTLRTLFWTQWMASLNLFAGIYRNTDEKLWLSQSSIWVFFPGVWSGITWWIW